MLKIWTSSIKTFRGQNGLDVSVKGGDPIGRIFAPTWRIVIGVKQGTLTERDYELEYHRLMLESYSQHRDVWDSLLAKDEVVLLCYCKKGAFCRRLLLAQYLQKLGGDYCGEL